MSELIGIEGKLICGRSQFLSQAGPSGLKRAISPVLSLHHAGTKLFITFEAFFVLSNNN